MNSVSNVGHIFNWTTNDGLKIYAKDWHVDNAKAVIVIVHGLGEHCERYSPMAQFYNDHEIGFVGYDRRGHGQSEGKRGHTINYQVYLDEVTELLIRVDKMYQEIPIFLYGHSMGGNIALNYALKKKSNITGLIATGSWIMLQQNPPSSLVFFAKFINKYYPTFTQNSGLNVKHISTVADEVEKYKTDPLVHSKITSNTGLEMIKAAEYLKNYNDEMPVPTLIMHGGADKITSPEGSQQFSKRAKGDLTYKEWPGLYHEIHNEVNRTEVFEYTLRWINEMLKK